MSGKEKAYVDVTQDSGDGGYVEEARNDRPTSKVEEADAERSRAREEEDAPPPAYTGPGPASNQTTTSAQTQHLSLRDDVYADIRALSEGDLKESISVPMIHSTETVNFKKLFSKNRTTVTQTVIVRKMPREHYLKHYAKDEEGNYVGTEKAAADAGLVFVPSKSTPEDILEQVRRVAFGKQHYASDFSAGATMVPFMMNTAGSGG